MDLNKKALFEISWEVCNKVGGIHTVIASKVFEAQNNFSNYFCVGPYLEHSMKTFEEHPIPNEFKEVIDELAKEDIIVHYGTWNIEGFPKTFLIEYLGLSGEINHLKEKLWDLWKVDSLGSHWHDFDEVFLWSWVSGIVIEKLGAQFSNDVFVHAHEWMSGGAIAYVNSIRNSKFKTVFTTHATMLGRTLSGSGESLEVLKENSPEDVATQIGVKTKFQFEKALACNSDCFTTVSDITDEEAKLVFGRKADIITYNGFDSCIDDIYTLERLFTQSRNFLDDFLLKFFYDFLCYRSHETYLLYTSGRYELKNKGIDILVKALGKLNRKLQKEKSEKQVVFWFMMMLGDFPKDQKVVDSFERAKKGEKPLNLGYAPLSPYELPLDNDLIKMLVDEDLINKEDNPVKVVVTPNQISEYDDLLNMPYYRLISGFNQGIFPSLYEPWGYTPAESLAYGVPAVTSDLCGIGKKACEFSSDSSFKVISRRDVEDEKAVDELVSIMYKTIELRPKEQMELKVHSKLCSKNFSWKVFYNHYLEAYDFASE